MRKLHNDPEEAGPRAAAVPCAWPDVRLRSAPGFVKLSNVIRFLRRLAALAGAPVAALAAWWVSLWALVSTSLLRSPDPAPALDGDPCCPHPDSWAQVAFGGAAVLVLAMIALALVVLAVALAGVAFMGRPPAPLRRHRTKLKVLAVASATCAFGAPTVLAVAAIVLT